MPPLAPDAAAARTIALQMLEERGRGDRLFLPDRTLGFLGAKVALARRLGLIKMPVERALSAYRNLRNALYPLG